FGLERCAPFLRFSEIVVRRIAASSTERASGPTQSRVGESGTMPSTETWSSDGLNPTIPQREAGIRMEPPVSVPTAATQSRATTAAAAPPLEPPGMREVSQGFLVAP